VSERQCHVPQDTKSVTTELLFLAESQSLGMICDLNCFIMSILYTTLLKSTSNIYSSLNLITNVKSLHGNRHHRFIFPPYVMIQKLIRIYKDLIYAKQKLITNYFTHATKLFDSVFLLMIHFYSISISINIHKSC